MTSPNYVMYQSFPRKVREQKISTLSGESFYVLEPLPPGIELSAAPIEECIPLTEDSEQIISIYIERNENIFEEMHRRHAAMRLHREEVYKQALEKKRKPKAKKTRTPKKQETLSEDATQLLMEL